MTEKVDFVAATVHELKTSLTAIIVSAELLADELMPEEKSVLGRLIQSIIRNARSIDERLSLFAEAGSFLTENPRFQMASVSIGPVIQDIAAQIYPEVQSRKQSLIVEVPDYLPPAKADRQYLEQILLSLMANATKFTTEEGQIKVGAHQDGRNIIVQVSDTGEGIPTEEQELIFQAYYQVKRDKRRQSAHTSQDKRHGDSGLGLAIAKFLVELQGGKIWLKSTIGQGSSFFFSLPMVVSVESSSS